MTPLRQRMLEDLQVRNLSPLTQRAYLEQVSRFARHFGQSPARLGPEEIRAYQVYLTTEKPLAPASIVVAVAALRFLYTVTLQKPWSVKAVIPAPKMPKTLPVVLSRAEVVRFLERVKIPRQRVILTTCYAAGLRILRSRTPDDPGDRQSTDGPPHRAGQRAEGSLRDALPDAARDPAGVVARAPPAALTLSRRSPRAAPHHQRGRARLPERRIGAAVFPSPLPRMRCATRLPCIFWKRAPTSAPFNCSSAIGASRRRRAIWRSPRPRCARPRVRSTCSRARARRRA